MKITEITSPSRKIIKQLNQLYISYVLNPELYDELTECIEQCKQSGNLDVTDEAEIISRKLISDLIRILSRKNSS